MHPSIHHLLLYASAIINWVVEWLETIPAAFRREVSSFMHN